ncbi:conserved hypothetical protein [uncultured Citrobacter sp.]|uniref:Uncharacterized protein n=1 Tax=uncultured Citrobacter sp. TaxID=200446 RepID=A0A212IR00_9ENTR|nr:conserved protein of unknown function [Citrobacter freundii]SBV68827.1 conserved hypothetical protein [uncultured Citrobacter sp.]
MIPVTSLDEDNRYASHFPLISGRFHLTCIKRSLLLDMVKQGINSNGYKTIKFS